MPLILFPGTHLDFSEGRNRLHSSDSRKQDSLKASLHSQLEPPPDEGFVTSLKETSPHSLSCMFLAHWTKHKDQGQEHLDVASLETKAMQSQAATLLGPQLWWGRSAVSRAAATLCFTTAAGGEPQVPPRSDTPTHPSLQHGTGRQAHPKAGPQTQRPAPVLCECSNLLQRKEKAILLLNPARRAHFPS